MNTNIQVPDEVREAHQSVHQAATGKWMTRLARLGYAMKGVVYLVIGVLATQLAIGRGGSATDQKGALQAIYEQPLGKGLMIVVAIGLLGFALWSLIQAIFDTEGKGKKAKGIVGRIGYAVVGVSYGLLALAAFRLTLGAGDAGQNSTDSAQSWTAKLLEQPFGVALVVLAGLLVLAVAGYLFYKAYSAKFRQKLGLASLNPSVRKAVIFVGRFGNAALGVVLAIVGLFLAIAAFQHDPQNAKGLDGVLQTLLHQPFGPFLLGIVALGLASYGAYSFVEARYRRLGRW